MAITLNHVRALFGARLKATPDPKRVSGVPYIYHEYFVATEPDARGVYPWMGRVYRDSEVVAQASGERKNRDFARADAIAWAEAKKAELRKG